MYLIYVDESGDPGLDKSGKLAAGGSEYFTRVAVLISTDKWFDINVSINKFRSDNKVPKGLELHATEIRKGQSQTTIRMAGKNKKKMSKNWWGHRFKTRAERDKLISTFLDAIVLGHSISIIAVTIDKRKIDGKKYNQKNEEHSIKNRSLTFLTERINEFLEQNKSKGMMIFDSVNATDDQRHSEFQKWLYKESDHISNKNFIETILFADSGNTGFLQLADICANTYWRHISGFDSADYNQISKQIFRAKIWPT